MLAVTLLPILLGLRVAAGPVVVDNNFITLPMVKKLNLTRGATLHQQDLARVAHLKGRAKDGLASRAVISAPADNQVVSYIAAVGVGSPATTYDLIIDTGSSNTWVGAGTAYVRTSTSTQTNAKVSVTYGSGSFSGTEFTDQVTIASGLVIPKQSIGVASRSTGFQGVDGILGIGPVDLTSGTLSTGGTIPTVTDNLFAQGAITSNLIGVSFEPNSNINGAVNGELTFGGTDSSKFTGSITFTPITSTSPANEFWGINQRVTYGSANTNILSSTAGIVDTGTTLVLLATDAFNRYRTATGGVLDSNTGLLRLTTAQFNALQNLNFVVGSTTFSLTPNAQAWPRALNTAIGGNTNSVYLIVNDLGSPSGEGLDFINGQTFLERFYSVFDTANHRVGFATTPFTTATTN